MEEIRNNGEYLPQYDVYIQYIKLPRSVEGSAAKVRGEQVAVINDSLTEDEKLLAIWHEILHLLRGDLDRDADIRTLEGGSDETSGASAGGPDRAHGPAGARGLSGL